MPTDGGCGGELIAIGSTLMLGYLTEAHQNGSLALVPVQRFGSGDVVIRRADGTVDVTGRLDRQVKLNGFRVQLDGIEAIVEQLNFVRAAVAIAAQSPGSIAHDLRKAAHIFLEGNLTWKGALATAERHLNENDYWGCPAAEKITTERTQGQGRAFRWRSTCAGRVSFVFHAVQSLPRTSMGKKDRVEAAHRAELKLLA